MDKIKKFIKKQHMEKKCKGAVLEGYCLQDDGQQSLNTCRQTSPIPQNKLSNSKKMPTDHSHIKSRALEMFQTGQGADCVIQVMPQMDGQDSEKKEFNVHKYVLMLNSDVFHAMFSHENTQEFREGRVQITDSAPAAVQQMLIFMYTGEMPKEYGVETDAVPLMSIANKYQIKSLVELIEQQMVDSLSLTNVIDWLDMADFYHMKKLYSACGLLIRRKLYKVKKEAKWLELKKKAPELAFSILEEFAEESGGHPCHHCGGYGHFARNCTEDEW